MAKEVEQPLIGVPEGGFTEEDLKAERLRIVEEKKKIIADLNKIQYPLNVTVFTHGAAWTVRNVAFWKAMQKRDEDVLDFMEKYLSENK